MDPQWFDALIQGLTEAPRPRRRALLRVVGAALSARLAGADVGTPVVAAAGCAKVGKSCKRADQCCSGICEGKHGKKKCRGHDAGTCQRGQDTCTDPDPDGDKCNNNADCSCIATTAGTSFCADVVGGGCADCARDADCLALGFPPGTACLVIGVGRCSGHCPNGTGCNPPCATLPPT